MCSSKSLGICPGAEGSQSVFPGPSASPGKLQIIGPSPGPLNQTQGAGRSGGRGREETAGEGPAQARSGILTRRERRSPSGPHSPLPVHAAERWLRRLQVMHPGARPQLQCTEAAAVVQSLSCVRLFCDPIHYGRPGSSVHGVSFRRSSQSRDQTCVTCISRQILYC